MAFLQLFFLKTHPEVAVVQQTALCTAECQCLEYHWTKAPRGVTHTEPCKIKSWEPDSQNCGSPSQQGPLPSHLKHSVTLMMYGLKHLDTQSEAQDK